MIISMISYVYDARQPIFTGFVKFRISFSVKWPYLVKIGGEGSFHSFTHIFNSTLLQSAQDQRY
jgi:hypothetical protein